MTRAASMLPPDFVWGASTAAFQVEGATRRDGRTDSIWDAFCRVPGAVVGGHDGTVATDSYRRFADDVAAARALNLDAYRFSASWARVRPDGGPVNQAGVDYYSRLVDALLEAGISPWLTLYHWDLPQTLEEQGGWAVRDTVHRFVDFALTMHDALGDRVAVWTTLNEPWCSAFLGYGNGQHAPGRSDFRAAMAAVHHLLLAHGTAAGELRRRDADATVAISLNLDVADPADPTDPRDVAAAARIDGQWNRLFLDPLFRGEYPADVLAETAHLGLTDHVRDGDLAVIATPIDVLGVNYYHGQAVSHRPPATPLHGLPATARPVTSPLPSPDGIHRVPRGLPRTSMGWEVQPEGLTRLLLRLHEEYTGPAGVALAVTETGAAYDDVVGPDGRVHDPERREFLAAHVGAVEAAVAAGADVRGFFVWSLLDNFEWAWGYTRRFGLVHVDYGTQRRTLKASGEWYAQVAAQGGSLREERSG